MDYVAYKYQRIPWIDAVKGICILLIALSHLNLNFEFAKYLYSGYIPIFFFLSGLTAKTTGSLKFDIKKKGSRLLFPHFFYSVFLNLFFLVPLFCLGNKNDVVNNFIGIFYARYSLYTLDNMPNIFFSNFFIANQWFLTAMFLAYIWFYLFAYVNKQVKFILIFGYVLVSLIFYKSKLLFPWSIDTSFLLSFYIIYAYFIRNNYEVINNNRKSIRLLVLVLSTILLYKLVLINGPINWSVRIFGIRNILSFFMVFLIGLIYSHIICFVFYSARNTRIIRIMSAIGRFSMTIMCVHPSAFFICEYINHHFLLNLPVFCLILEKILLSILFFYIVMFVKQKFSVHWNLLKHI